MKVRDADGVRQKYGVEPQLIPDYLALVGDAADGYPGIPGIGPATAARLLNKYGPIEHFPPDLLTEERERALLFKDLATLRAGEPLFANVDELRWLGVRDGFAEWSRRLEDDRLLERCRVAAAAVDA
jgi:5'-3' exonuclease